MPLESPLSVLYNTSGVELALSQSQLVVTSSQPGYLIMGSGSDGRAHFLKTTADGTLVVSGNFGSGGGGTTVLTQSVLEVGCINTNVSSALASTTSYMLLSSNGSRRGATFYKEGTNICYLKLGNTASSTSYTVRLTNNGYYELPTYYAGRVDVVFTTSDTGNSIHVTEILL